MKQYNIVITGANGFIGNYLTHFFSEKGHNVLALVHHQIKAQNNEISYGLFDLNSIDENIIPDGTDIVIHAAYAKSKENNFDLNAFATQKLYEISKRKSVKQFVFLSSFSAQNNAISNYGKSKFSSCQVIDTKEHLIIEPGLVIGEGGLFLNMSQLIVQNPIIPLIGSGKQIVQYILIKDLAEIICYCIDNQINGHYKIAHPGLQTMKQFLKEIAKKKSKRVIFFPIPFWVADFLFALVDLFKIKIGIDRENLNGLRQMKHQDLMLPDGLASFKFTPFEKYGLGEVNL